MLAATKRKRGPDSDDLKIEQVARGFLAEQESQVYKEHLETLEDSFEAEELGYGSGEEDNIKVLGLDNDKMRQENSSLNRVSNLKKDLKIARNVIRLLLKAENNHMPGEGDLEAFKDFYRKEEQNENDGNKRLLSEVLRDERKKGRFGLDDAFYKKNEE
jgi:hypothetical protein